jgi:UDP-N-acetylglucosamine acyltransferase
VIHPTAIVSAEAELAEGVDIGPYAVVEAGVRIGPRTRLGAYSYVCSGTTLGAENVVHMHAVLGNEPQDLAYGGAPTHLVIGDRNVFREGCHVHRGTAPDSATVIGNDCYLMTNSHVGHNSSLADRVILATAATLAGHVSIGAGAFVSGAALVHQHTRVGRLAMLQGGCAVSRDVPPFLIAARPTNLVAGVNAVGLKRAGFDRPRIVALRRAYRVLFGRRVNLSLARQRLLAMEEAAGGPTADVLELLAFIDEAKRGVCFGSRGGAGTESGAE